MALPAAAMLGYAAAAAAAAIKNREEIRQLIDAALPLIKRTGDKELAAKIAQLQRKVDEQETLLDQKLVELQVVAAQLETARLAARRSFILALAALGVGALLALPYIVRLTTAGH